MGESLDALLARLKAEIDDAEHGDLDRAELARLARAVERRLGDDDEDEEEGLVDELRQSVARWESTHPRLAAAIGRVADALGGIGL